MFFKKCSFLSPLGHRFIYLYWHLCLSITTSSVIHHLSICQSIPLFFYQQFLLPFPLYQYLPQSTYRLSLHHAPPSIPPLYLHGNGVFNQHRSQLSVQLKEDFSLAGLVQVSQCQRFDVEGFSSLQLHLGINKAREQRTGGPSGQDSRKKMEEEWECEGGRGRN